MVKSKKKKKITPKKLKHIMLKEWSRLVKERDNYTCQGCGNIKHLNSHHILPKEYLDMRYDILNGVTLCPYCHRLGKNAAHQNALYFTYFLQSEKEDQYVYLMDRILLGAKE